MRVITIVGPRPQFIKAAVVSRAIEEFNQTASTGGHIEEVLVYTGQYYDNNMSDVFLRKCRYQFPGNI
jgi:UDP-GlcNAc3NAcA epimerase